MPTPRVRMDLEGEVLLAVGRALNLVDTADEPMLARFDRIAGVARSEGLSFTEAAARCGLPVERPMLAMLAHQCLYNWFKGGSVAFVPLANGILQRENDAEDFESRVLALMSSALKPVAVARNQGGRGLPAKDFGAVGGDLLSLARWLDVHGVVPEVAAECALQAADLLRRCKDARSAAADQLALRLLDQAPKQAFLPLVPRAKYPPRPSPILPREVVQQVVCQTLAQVFLDFLGNAEPQGAIRSRAEFDAVARRMLDDADEVIELPVQLSYPSEDGEPVRTPIERLEFRFGTPLLQRVERLSAIADRPDVTPCAFLIDLITQLLHHEDMLEHSRDPYLHDWFIVRGVEPHRQGAFFSDALVCVQTIGWVMHVMIGETEDDIDSWFLYERHAITARDFLRRAKAALA